jgi:HEAT repeat protein
MPFQDYLTNAEQKGRSDQPLTKTEIDTLIEMLLEAQNQESERDAVGSAKIRAAVLRIIVALRPERWEVRSDAILALEKLGTLALTGIQAALTDHDWFVRATAANALGRIQDAQAVKGLINILSDEEWFVRERAAEALSKIGEPAVEPLIDALKDGDGLVRERAAEALSKIGEPAVEPLIDALKDGDGLVRERAAEILGKIGSMKSLIPLQEAFNDHELYVRARAVLAFELVNAKNAKSTDGPSIHKQRSSEFRI